MLACDSLQQNWFTETANSLIGKCAYDTLNSGSRLAPREPPLA